MKITLWSDIHLEFSSFEPINLTESDVLILAGDCLIASMTKGHTEFANRFNEFFSKCNDLFANIIVIAGNHEFYKGHWYKSLDVLREFYAKFNNITFLEQDSIQINNVTFVGGTMWTNMNNGDPLTIVHVPTQLNDFRVIRHDKRNYRKLLPKDVMARYYETENIFHRLINESLTDKVVVVTHHCPTTKSVSDEHKHDHLTNGAYVNNLSNFILDHVKIKYWCCGHTHWAHEYSIGQCTVICNPRGYHSKFTDEHTGFDPTLTFEI